MRVSNGSTIQVAITAEAKGKNVSGGRLLAFGLTNASVAIFFDVFWLLGYRIKELDDLSGNLGYFIFELWFLSFFLASFFALNAVVKERVIVKCLLLALVFSVFEFFLLGLSTMVLGPFIDPWY
jgi:hypothetical protein